MTNLKDLKSIIVTRDDGLGNTKIFHFTYNEFKQVFIDKKVRNEYRYHFKETIFGKVHHTTVIQFRVSRSIRKFDFPTNEFEAHRRHKEFTKNDWQ